MRLLILFPISNLRLSVVLESIAFTSEEAVMDESGI